MDASIRREGRWCGSSGAYCDVESMGEMLSHFIRRSSGSEVQSERVSRTFEAFREIVEEHIRRGDKCK